MSIHSKVIKVTKYRKNMLTLAAVNGDIGKFEDLEKVSNFKYSDFLYYSIRHAHLELSEFFLSRIDLTCYELPLDRKIPTDRYIPFIENLLNNKKKFPLLYKYRKKLIYDCCENCYMKMYAEKLLYCISLVRPKNERKKLFNSYLLKTKSANSKIRKDFATNMGAYMRDDIIDELLKN